MSGPSAAPPLLVAGLVLGRSGLGVDIRVAGRVVRGGQIQGGTMGMGRYGWGCVAGCLRECGVAAIPWSWPSPARCDAVTATPVARGCVGPLCAVFLLVAALETGFPSVGLRSAPLCRLLPGSAVECFGTTKQPQLHDRLNGWGRLGVWCCWFG